MGMLYSDLFKFPFQASVWGTAADWLIVATTILGLIYIIRTFRSQIEVQQSQIALLQIETDKFVEEKKPSFELIEFDFSGEQIDPENPNIMVELRKTGQLDALELKVSAPRYKIENVGAMDVYREHERLTLLYYNRDGQTTADHFHSFITFSDRYGNRYRQVISTWLNLKGERDSGISIPRMNESFNK
jgi:hypothetical protein